MNRKQRAKQLAEEIFNSRLWSYSSYATLKRCPYAFYQLYIKGIDYRAEESEAAKVGHVVHDTFQTLIPLAFTSVSLQTIEDVLLKNAREKGISEEKALKYAPNVQRILNSIHEKQKDYDLILPEQDLTSGRFRGRIDLILISNKKKLVYVVDHKTTTTNYSSLYFYKEQLYLYGWLVLENLSRLTGVAVNKNEYKVLHAINFAFKDKTLWDEIKMSYIALNGVRKSIENNIKALLAEQIYKHGFLEPWDAVTNNLCSHCDVRHVCPIAKPQDISELQLRPNDKRSEYALDIWLLDEKLGKKRIEFIDDLI